MKIRRFFQILTGASAALCVALLPELVAAKARDAELASQLLEAHNAERARLGIAPLRWSPALAQQASTWADNLAQRGRLEHARDRSGAGENLWMGSASYYGPNDMIGRFIDERRAFRPGVFPHISRTGNWADVGHYTQLIWPGTQEVGCALSTGAGNDVLVCRYWPAGNVIGQKVP